MVPVSDNLKLLKEGECMWNEERTAQWAQAYVPKFRDHEFPSLFEIKYNALKQAFSIFTLNYLCTVFTLKHFYTTFTNKIF